MRAATRTAEDTTHGTSPVLYLAFELGVEEWKLGFTTAIWQNVRARHSSSRCEAAGG